MVAELDGDGVVSAWYVHGLNVDEPLARIDNSTGAVLYYHADILGSIVALTNSSGGVETQYNYSPFGVTQVMGTDVSQPFRFTGREWDAETGLYYYRARYYSPGMGRFITEDPIRFASGDVNWYRYVGNDPVNLTDPLGLFPPAPDTGPPGSGGLGHPPDGFCAQISSCDVFYTFEIGICYANSVQNHDGGSWEDAYESLKDCLEGAEIRRNNCLASKH
jgi:RHS repeat-associated protein